MASWEIKRKLTTAGPSYTFTKKHDAGFFLLLQWSELALHFIIGHLNYCKFYKMPVENIHSFYHSVVIKSFVDYLDAFTNYVWIHCIIYQFKTVRYAIN